MIILRVLLVVVLAVIAYMSLSPPENIHVGNDKIGHLIAYAVLTLNMGMIIHPHKRKLLVFALLSFAYGVIMECGQYFVPGRDVSIYDVMANTSGVLIGVLVLIVWGDRIQMILHKAKII